MDVLSDAVAVMRTGRPHSTRVARHAPWGWRFPPVAGAGFHVVLQGACWLFPPSGPPVALAAGDVVFLPREVGHGLADNPSTPLTALSAPPDNLRAGVLRVPRNDEVTPAAADPGADPGTGQHARTVMLCGAYQLDRSRSHPLLGELPEIVHLPARAGHHPSLRAAVELLGGELEQPRPGSGAILPALLDMLLLYILRAWLDDQANHHTATGWAAALSDPAVTAALRAIHHDPARPWTVQALGAHAGLSRAAFARRFTSLIGQPPLRYLTWWRMTKAAQRLRESDAPLHAVAKRVGYSSESAFASAFKREYGTSPGAYRQQE